MTAGGTGGSWGLDDFVVLPKSTHCERILENLGALEFTLSDAEMVELDALDGGSIPGQALERKWWSVDDIQGFPL